MLQVKDVCHLWEVAGGTAQQLVTTVLQTCSLRALSIVLVLDLSRPEHIYEEMCSTLQQIKVKLDRDKVMIIVTFS